VGDLRLADAGVSRRHATLLRTPAGLRIVDAGSLSGVHVSGTRVLEQPLRDGDVVHLGRSVAAA
jgi:pSer/pThr/pTyr-binding forkhead associated (FHA) protein